jgi:hypothetical protein
MYIFSLFELSGQIEEAVTSLESKGIKKEFILAVPLNSRNESKSFFDTVHFSDSTNTMTLPLIMAMMTTLLFSIYGFQLKWGPILWALIGAFIGLAAGMLISLTRSLIYKQKQKNANRSNVILIVQCEKNMSEHVQQILWTNAAFGVSELNKFA